MSTTPRTDSATYPADCLGKTLVVHRDCAAALEVELKEAEAELAAMKARAEKAEDDTLRLDWLLKNQVSTQHYGCKFSYYRWYASRTAIDASMKEDSK